MTESNYKTLDNIYLNISFQPTYMSNSESLLEYNVTKDTPILDKMSDYYASIIRFDIPLATIPITIFPIIPNQPNPNLSPLIIGISYLGVNYPQNVILQPQFNTAAFNIQPTIQNQPKQIVTLYHFIYEYDWMIHLFNVALAASYNASPLPGLFPTAAIPYFTFDPVTQLISLIVPSFFVNITAPATAVPQININYLFYQYLDNFPYFENGKNVPSGFDATIRMSNANIHDINGYALYGTAPTNPPSYYKLTQNQNSIQYWNPIKKILLTSDSIPIAKEYVQGSTVSTGNNPSLPIITDFTPVIISSSDGRSIAYYLPTAEYRKVDMISDLSLRKISMKVYWEDIYGDIFPLNIGSYQQASIKIVFLHKSMYKTSIDLDKIYFPKR